MKPKARKILIWSVVLGLPVVVVAAKMWSERFSKARRIAIRNACIGNLRMIDGAKDQYVLEHGVPSNGMLTKADISVYFNGTIERNTCFLAPDTNGSFGASYRINPVGVDPECKLCQDGTHSLSYIHRE